MLIPQCMFKGIKMKVTILKNLMPNRLYTADEMIRIHQMLTITALQFADFAEYVLKNTSAMKDGTPGSELACSVADAFMELKKAVCSVEWEEADPFDPMVN